MLANRDANNHANNRSHFFKSFFVTKLLDEGCSNQYRYANVKRWSKRVPGQDVFQLNKIFMPVNVGGVHWCCAVIDIPQKRIQFYDSMAGSGTHILSALFQYLQDEYQNKKHSPMPHLHEWKLIPGNDPSQQIPQQQNGYDCGVFTCMFADFISRDVPLLFTQKHINECRKRIALSILLGTALD